MTILLHVVIAFASLGYSAYVFFAPSQAKLRISYGLITATILSGTALLVSAPSHMLEACIMGLLYTGVASIATVSARRKLATQTDR